MKDSERKATEAEATLEARDEARQSDVGMGASNEKVAQDTFESFHDSMIRQATQENKEKLLAEVKKVVLKSLLERKAMVREMERLDAQISQHDAKLETLTHLVETDQIIEASEVRTFMQGGSIGFVIMDLETTGFSPMGNIDLGYSPEKAAALNARIRAKRV